MPKRKNSSLIKATMQTGSAKRLLTARQPPASLKIQSKKPDPPTTPFSIDSATKSKTCSAVSKIGYGFTPATTAALMLAAVRCAYRCVASIMIRSGLSLSETLLVSWITRT